MCINEISKIIILNYLYLQKFRAQSMEDGVIEVIGFWSSTFVSINHHEIDTCNLDHPIIKLISLIKQGKLQMGIARGERIAQCRHIKMVTDVSLPIQIDGGMSQLLDDPLPHIYVF